MMLRGLLETQAKALGVLKRPRDRYLDLTATSPVSRGSLPPRQQHFGAGGKTPTIATPAAGQ